MSDPDMTPPRGILERSAVLSWRFLLVVAALIVLGIILARLELVVVPLVVGLLIAVVVSPVATWSERHGLGRTLGAALVFLVMLAGIAGFLFVFGPGFLTQFRDLADAVVNSLGQLRDWLVQGLGLSPDTVDSLFAQVRRHLTGQGGLLQSGLVTGATTAAKVVTGAVLALILGFIFAKDGPELWAWCLRLLPERRRSDADAAGRRTRDVLRGYLFGSTVNGAIEASIIGVALLLLGTPLVLPLILLQFVAAYFPLVGAVAAGTIATLVTLAATDLTHALILAGVIVLVNQLEGNVLAPLVLGNAVRLHPVVVLVVLTAGGVLAGVIGAFVAVPVTAVGWGVLKELVQRDVVEPPGDEEIMTDEPPGDSGQGGDEKQGERAA